MKVELVECARKFVFMLKTYHRHCKDTTFYLKDEESIKIFVNNRVMLDAAFFRKINLNYIKSQSYELIREKMSNDEYFDAFLKSSSERILN